MGDVAKATEGSNAVLFTDVFKITVKAGQTDQTTKDQQTIGCVGKLGTCQIHAGSPSAFTIYIPLSDKTAVHEDANKVALKANKDFLNETRCRLDWASVSPVLGATAAKAPVMVGSIVERNHDLSNDALTLKVLDDLYLLTKYSIFGQYMLSADRSFIFFDSSKDTVFNPNGWPNCMDSDHGPVFAPTPRYGWHHTDTDEPPPGNALTRARSWRITDVLTYILNSMNDGAQGTGTSYATVSDSPARDLQPKPVNSEYISLYSNIGEQLTIPDGSPAQTSAASTQRSVRYVHNLNLQALNLYMALLRVCEAAGPFVPYVSPSGESDGKQQTAFRSQLNFMFTGAPPPTASKQRFTASGKGVMGYLKESSEKYHRQTVIAGQPVKIERMLSTDGGTVAAAAAASPVCRDFDGLAMGAATSVYSGALQPKWTTDDQTAWCDYIYDNQATLGVSKAFERANSLYPLVFNAYGASGNWDYTEGTKYSEVADTLPRLPVLFHPDLLTGQQCRVSPSTVTANDPSYWRSLDTYIQCYTVAGDPSSGAAIDTGTWNTPTYYDGLKLGVDRTYFEVPGLRDSAEHPTWRGTLVKGSLTKATFRAQIKANHIRLTTVVEAQFRMFKKLTSDFNKTGGRVSGESLYTYFAITDDDYLEWLRKDSYPYGKRAETTALPLGADANGKMPDKCTLNSELFSDGTLIPGGWGSRISEHGAARQREVNRVYCGGSMVYRNYEPGLGLGATIGEWSTDANQGVTADSRVTSITFDEDQQTFTYEFT